MRKNIKHFSLRSKLLTLVSLPTLLFLATAIYLIVGKYQFIEKISGSIQSLHAIKASSYLTSELQKERGKSVLSLSASGEKENLDKQRNDSDTAKNQFIDALRKSALSSSLKEQLAKLPDMIESARKSIRPESTKENVIATYSSIIEILLSFQVLAGSEASATEEIVRISLMESSKENLGKLRALGSSLLARNTNLSLAEVRSIENLKAGTQMGLLAPAMRSSSTSYQKVEHFLAGDNWKKVVSKVDKILAMSQTGGFNEDPRQFFTEATSCITDINGIISYEFDNALSNSEVRLNNEKWFGRLIASITGSGLLLIVAALILIIRSICKPINEIIANLETAAGSVQGASIQLSKISEQISSSSVQAAASFEETTASIEEINSSLQNTADRTSDAAKISQESKESASLGVSNIQDLSSSINEVEKSSEQMREIITVIDDIAFQTNLLALNASVEAARAGEQGKGFAVVAEAVRSLAGRSASAAKDISLLIQENTAKTQTSVSLASQSNEVIKKLNDSFSQVTTLIVEVESMVKNQETGLAMISKAMVQLDKSAQQNAASSEEAAASSEDLKNNSDHLYTTVSRLTELIKGSRTT